MGRQKEEEVLRSFGKNVKLRRQALGISQEQLASKCGLHRTYISDIERGRRNVSLKNIARIANALDLSISELFVSIEGGK